MPSEVLIWPKWWYSEGLEWFFTQLKQTLVLKWQALRLHLWVKHLFTPMFGMKDPVSLMVSVVIRTLAICGKILWGGVMLCLALACLAVYISAPPVLGFLLIKQLL